jgi:isopentenyl phosphate kinase
MGDMTELVFLKLGGSLITDKTQAYTVRPDKLDELARQIAVALDSLPGLTLILGHGSGSFGHTAAKEYQTRAGLQRPAALASGTRPADEIRYWHGFAEVWFQAAQLNRFVMEALHKAQVPALALAPVSAVSARNGKVSAWDSGPLKAALTAGLLPVIYGDVIFDEARGGTILSTEDLFERLARELKPERILLAGLEGAVWADFPERKQRLERITPASFEEVKTRVGASQAADVTGGMDSKVRQMLSLVTENPGLTAQIFSGEEPGNILKALAGENLGTILAAA